jgi:uncharacterized protein YjiS (DUF1127 family)
MAIDIQVTGSSPKWLGSVAAMFRTFRHALRHREAEAELHGLSDRYLHDIGVERSEISERVAREITRASLAELGWSNRPRRR